MVLPVAALVDQYKATPSPVVQQLDLMFILHSIPRLDLEDRRLLIPQVIRGIAKDGTNSSAANMLNILLSLLPDLKLPSRGSQTDETLREAMGLSDAKDSAFLANWLLKSLLVKMPSVPDPPVELMQTYNPALTTQDLEFLKLDKPDGKRVFARIAELKLKAISLLASAAFTDQEKFLPALYASATSDSRISQIGEEMLKRTTVSMEDGGIVRSLFDAHSHLPAPHRTRILTLLAKSAVAATMTDDILAVVTFDLSPDVQGLSESTLSQAILAPSGPLERTKLYRALFQFLSRAATSPIGAEGFKAGPMLIAQLQAFIVSQGWPVPSKASPDHAELRSTAYDIIGALVTRAQLQDPLPLGDWLFKSLSQDPTSEAVVSIDGALSSLSPTIRQEDGNSQINSLSGMLLSFMELSDEPPAVRSVRHMAVKWANRSLPFYNAKARWIDILAISGRMHERSDVVEEGRKGLDPWTHYAHSESKPQYPNWTELVSYFFERLVNPLNEAHTVTSGSEGMDLDTTGAIHDTINENFSGQRLGALPVALGFCKNILFLTTVDDFKLGPDWEMKLEAGIRSDIKLRAKVKAYLKTVNHDHMTVFLEACINGLLRDSRQVTEECLNHLVILAKFSPGKTVGRLASRAAELLPFVTANNDNIRSLAAQAFGILAAHPKNSQETVKMLVGKLTASVENYETAVGSQLNAVSGALIAHAYLCSRMVYYGRSSPELNQESRLLDLLIDKTVHVSLRPSVIEALGQMWTARLVVPSLSTNGPTTDSEFAAAVKSLTVDAKSGNETAIWALGRLGMGIKDGGNDKDENLDGAGALSSGPLGSILTNLFSLYEIRQVDIHFAVGEAIASAVACWDSDHVQLSLDVDSDIASFRHGYRPLRILAVLDKLFEDCKSTKPSLLKASGIWLFSIVQYCSHLGEVQSRLREAQAAFMRLLSARDDLVQETASRGLSLVYERGDSELRSQLVKDLVSAFTGSSTQLKVDQDTELFEPGVLATGEGQSVTSYRDIVNLANEVGDQSLVYKFMSLASNAATWSTRSAFGRFGLGSILSESEVDPKLYPKLFRYRFDPNPNVQRSMNDIWKALVKDANNVIDKHFDAIMTDLLKCILGREWRVREACCAALSDLMHGRPFEKYEKYYDEIWRSATKVCDDIKGSVREAALRMCFGMANTLVRQLEESGTSTSTRTMMNAAIRFLFSESGIESGVEEVKVFATVTAIKIAKNGGTALRPFIPTMVPRFLDLPAHWSPTRLTLRTSGRAKRDARPLTGCDPQWYDSRPSQKPLMNASGTWTRTSLFSSFRASKRS